MTNISFTNLETASLSAVIIWLGTKHEHEPTLNTPSFSFNCVLISTGISPILMNILKGSQNIPLFK